MGFIVITTKKRLERIISKRVEEAIQEQKKSDEQEILIKQTELNILTSQINPHFLYNTLECICGLALINNDYDVADITSQLSQYFRYCVSRRENIVTLHDEIENAKNYISLQKFRFPEKFTVKFDYMNDLEEILLPKLTLQPIIENAILHGLKDITTDGVLRILIEKKNNIAVIRISDNGAGMNPLQLDKLREEIRSDGERNTNGRHSGIGLQNVDKRIKLYFGKQFGVVVDSCENIGTEVRISFPIKAK